MRRGTDGQSHIGPDPSPGVASVSPMIPPYSPTPAAIEQAVVCDLADGRCVAELSAITISGSHRHG
jgi:hypothetical protein